VKPATVPVDFVHVNGILDQKLVNRSRLLLVNKVHCDGLCLDYNHLF